MTRLDSTVIETEGVRMHDDRTSGGLTFMTSFTKPSWLFQTGDLSSLKVWLSFLPHTWTEDGPKSDVQHENESTEHQRHNPD